jgi:hypothetical protein
LSREELRERVQASLAPDSLFVPESFGPGALETSDDEVDHGERSVSGVAPVDDSAAPQSELAPVLAKPGKLTSAA